MNRIIEIADISAKMEKGLNAIETIIFAMENSGFCESDPLFSNALWYVHQNLEVDLKNLRQQIELKTQETEIEELIR